MAMMQKMSMVIRKVQSQEVNALSKPRGFCGKNKKSGVFTKVIRVWLDKLRTVIITNKTRFISITSGIMWYLVAVKILYDSQLGLESD